MKYKVIPTKNTLLDLEDNVGVEQLIEENQTNGHVYIAQTSQLKFQEK